MPQIYAVEAIADLEALFFKSAGHMVQVEEDDRLVRVVLIITLTGIEIKCSLIDDKVSFVGEATKHI